MQKIIADTLLCLGATDKEVRFFLASYSTGTATVSDIAKIAKLERSTAYLISQKLVKKGLITEDSKSYNKLLTPATPSTLLRMVAAKKRQIGRQEIVLKDNMERLQRKYLNPSTIPKVRVYEGAAGLLAIWRDILSKKQEVLLWTNQATEDNLFTKNHHQMFIQNRISQGISMRVLAVDNPQGSALIPQDSSCLRQTKLLPKSVSFSSETYIYGNKIATLDFNKDIIGVITESTEIAESQRAIFNMNWHNLT